MRLPKSIISLSAIAVCAFAVCNAHAQSATNNVTLTVTETQEGTGTDVTNKIGTIYKIPTKNVVLNTAGIISELGHAVGIGFTSAAKLQLILGGSNPQFAVSDGANFILISTNIMNLSQPSTNNPVFSGAAMYILPEPSLKALQVAELDFNDVGLGTSSNLQFSLRGIENLTLTGAKLTQSGYTENISLKISLAGDGLVQGTNNFVATGSLSASGSGLIFP